MSDSGELVAVNAFQLSWEPKWNQERFLGNLGDEVRAVQELDTVKTTVFDVLMATGK